MPDCPTAWFVYMIRCSDGALYTGISVDVERRFQQHLNGGGAKFFRTRRPRELVYLESGHDRSSASQREWAIKQLSPLQKLALLGAPSNQLGGVKRA